MFSLAIFACSAFSSGRYFSSSRPEIYWPSDLFSIVAGRQLPAYTTDKSTRGPPSPARRTGWPPRSLADSERTPMCWVSAKSIDLFAVRVAPQCLDPLTS